jgi:protocatechuate 3,4-dioxygenase beta subunit
MIFSSFFRIRVTTGIALLVLLCAGHTVAQSYTIAGVAVSATSGLPLSGTAVRLAAQSSGATLGTRITGKDGGFRFEPLAAGKYQLRGMRRGFLPTEYEQHGDFSSAVVTGPAQETMHLLLRMAPEAELHGVVTGEESEPVEGATVMLFRCPDPHQPGRKIEMLDTVKADDTGAYVFSHLRPGEYRLTVKGEPWFAVPRTSSTSGTRALDLAYPLTYFDGATSEVTAAPIPRAAHCNFQGARPQEQLRAPAAIGLRVSVARRRLNRARRGNAQRNRLFPHRAGPLRFCRRRPHPRSGRS